MKYVIKDKEQEQGSKTEIFSILLIQWNMKCWKISNTRDREV